MGDVRNVYAAEPTTTGCIFVADLDTPGPSLPDPFAALDEGFIDLGDAGEDGFTETAERNIEKKRNFGGKVVKVLQTEFSQIYEFVLLESLNAEVLKAIYGSSNVTVVAADSQHGEIVQVKKNAKRLPHLSWVIDTVDTQLNAKYRTYIPDGQIFDTGEVTVVHTDTISYTVQLEAFEVDGNHAFTWSDNGQLSGS